MPVALTIDDFNFLVRVRELGLAGNTQDEIAASFELTRTTLRNRLAGLGFEFQPTSEVRALLGKRTLAALIEAGEIIAESEAEPAAVAA